MAKDKHLVICVGDSITYGLGVAQNRDKASYPVLLEKLLGPEYEVKNYGVNARTLISTGDRPYFVLDEAKASLKENADIVLFMLGTNDVKPDHWDAERYKKELPEALKRYINMDSQPKVYVMIPPKSFDNVGTGREIKDASIKNVIAKVIPEVAKDLGIDYIDLYTPLKEHPELYREDGVHPNFEGNKLIAKIIYEKLKVDL